MQRIAPAITTQPANISVIEGQTATFNVTASGTAPLTYQWKKDGANVGSNSSSYTTPATTLADTGARFSVTVSNAAGDISSEEATLTVTALTVAPSITSQPASISVTVGQTATFNVTASGTAPLTYQWMKDGVNVGTNASSYTTPATELADDGAIFSVVVSNAADNVTSAGATLTVTATPVAPTITTQPSDQSVTEGHTAIFNVTASGTAPLTYQWKKDGVNVGTNSSSYTTPATALADDGATFSVVVSNAVDDVTSAGATLTVTAASSTSYVADYRVATEAALRAIPDSYINTARTTLHVAYNHTSHGTHVSYGAFGLPGFKAGDATKFGITRNTTADPTKLDFHDGEISGTYPDLSTADADWSVWRNQVRDYLDNPANAAINVMMWSWCDIAGHSVPNYLSSMQTMIDEYGQGGSKIGVGGGHTRTTPVTFIFMTGHANANNNVGADKPRDQAALITDYCETHGYYCIDYYSIDTHAMNNTYYEDTGDNGNSVSYGGNFYEDWQGSHSLGVDWYENRSTPGGAVTFGEHNTQHITANRKAFAFWWVLARIAGY